MNMSVASATGPSVAVPSVSHAPTDQTGLAEKVTLRDLNFFYGESRALKSSSQKETAIARKTL